MQANKGRDTSPEVAIRSALHRRGLRFRVNQSLPFNRRRRADITFPKAGLFVFVDGCFWHKCPEHYVPPKTRASFWAEKISANVLRDSETNEELQAMGLVALRIWEHQDPQEAANSIAQSYYDLRRK